MSAPALVRAALERAAAGEPPAGLEVTYSDMHGLWGGVTVMVTPDGWERTERAPGSPGAEVTRGTLGDGVLAALATLLLELKAWEQRVPVATPVPDESRATLTVRCEGGATTVWERYNDLAAGRRLFRVRDHVLGICG